MSYKCHRSLNVPINVRFWTKVQRTDSCWLWMAARDYRGYGVFMEPKFDHRKHGRISAHRFAYKITHAGYIPPNLVVRHTCDNPPCVNPDHLILGTQKDNSADMVSRGRHLIGNQKKAKLSVTDIKDIRAMRASGMKVKDIQKKYPISRWYLGLIYNGKIRGEAPCP